MYFDQQNLIIILEWLLVLVIFFLYAIQFWRSRKILSEFKKVKIKIEHDKAKEEAMLGSIGDGVVATDKDGIIIFINQAAKDALSWDDKMVGKKLGEVSLLADEKGKHIPLEKHPLYVALIKRKKIVTSDYHFIRKDKVDLAVYISAMPIILDKEIIGAIEVFRDITQEKEIDKIKSEFVFLASHQLRTPLSTVNWYVEALLSGDAGKLNEDQKTYLKEIDEGTKNMGEIVKDLLNVSRLDLGTLTIEPVSINLSRLIKSILEEVHPIAEDKELQIQNKVSTNFSGVISDEKMLRMLVQNLITNAVKYTPDNGNINIDAIKQDDNFILTVADTGMGIPKESQPKIFTKLFRADNVLETEINGTGLGLYMVKTIVEKFGGKIWFESEINKGTKFFVSLPMHISGKNNKSKKQDKKQLV